MVHQPSRYSWEVEEQHYLGVREGSNANDRPQLGEQPFRDFVKHDQPVQGVTRVPSKRHPTSRVTDGFVRKEVIEKLESEIKSFVKGTKVASSRLEASVKDLETKYNDYTKYLPKWVKSTRNQITHRNGRAVLCSPAPLWLCGWNYYSSDYEFHDGEPEGEVCKKCKASALEQEGAGG
jgi:hypothetical protein